MMRAAVFIWLLTLSLFSCDTGFGHCLKKVDTLGVLSGSGLRIPLESGKILLFSKKTPKNAILSDPFLHLYLIPGKMKPKHPFKINRYLPSKELASVRNGVVCGHLAQKQVGLEQFALFSKKISTPSVILNACCELVAIGTERGIIEKAFIKHFLRHGGRYGDLGIRTRSSEKDLIVTSCNPFVKSPFKTGDRILSLSGKAVRGKADFEKRVLFAPVGSKCTITLSRNGETKEIEATIHERRGGGYLSDTFLETKGVYLDEQLRVISSSTPVLHKNDRIFMLNSKRVKSYEDIRRAFCNSEGDSFLLGLNRNGLDIFIKLKID